MAPQAAALRVIGSLPDTASNSPHPSRLLTKLNARSRYCQTRSFRPVDDGSLPPRLRLDRSVPTRGIRSGVPHLPRAPATPPCLIRRPSSPLPNASGGQTHATLSIRFVSASPTAPRGIWALSLARIVGLGLEADRRPTIHM